MGDGKMSEKDANTDMIHSCLKVVTSIVRGSDGDRERVSEYMGEVCNEKQDPMSRQLCEKFSGGVYQFMNGDLQYNRDELDMKPFCQMFWQSTIHDAALKQKKIMDEEELARKKRENELRQEQEKKREAAEKARI